MDRVGDFTALTPDVLLDAVEAASGMALAGFAHPLNSYINRVYELQTLTGERVIAKFYRPGRWSRQAVEDEHTFVLECAAEEIPVIAPLPLQDGSTLGEAEGILFAVYPKRWGREFEATCDEDWRRLGRVLGRVHMIGARNAPVDRVTMHPRHSTASDVAHLHENGVVAARYSREFNDLTDEILAAVDLAFTDVELIRIHGDCHVGNILERPDEGLMLIDFDDMVTGPPVQDLWMLLPDSAETCRRELRLILEGYTVFHGFDHQSLRLIEALRVMRMLYFLAWLSRQVDDPNFESNFPQWHTDSFWRKEMGDLRQQLQRVQCSSTRA